MIGRVLRVMRVSQRVRDILFVEIQVSRRVASGDAIVFVAIGVVRMGGYHVSRSQIGMMLSLVMVAELRMQICCGVMVPRGRRVSGACLVVLVCHNFMPHG
jgi:hypothetical protein